MNTKLLATAAMAAALTVGIAQTAHANPYGFALNIFSNFKIGLTGGATVNSVSVTTSDSSQYPGTVPTANTVTNFTLGAFNPGSDVTQAKNGPGPFPGENFFAQSVLKTGQGSRGDSQVDTGNPFTTGASSGNVAENRLDSLLTPGTSITAFGKAVELVNLTTVAAGTITFTFDVTALLEALTELPPGEVATAEIQNSITIRTLAGVLVDNFAPMELNQNVSASFPAADQVYSFSGFFSHTVTLAAGTSYQVTLSSLASETVSTPAAIPEPASLMLLGAGLAGLGLVSRRKRS